MVLSAFKAASVAAPESATVYIGAGSNIEPARHLHMACTALDEAYGPLTVSSVYRNPAVGFDGDDFLNMVISFRTDAPPSAINEFLRHLHVRAGRDLNDDGFVSRTLDLDLLLYGDRVFEQDGIKVPRDDICEYGFVLGPLAEIAPDLKHPTDGRAIRELWEAFDGEQYPMVKLPLPLL